MSPCVMLDKNGEIEILRKLLNYIKCHSNNGIIYNLIL